MRILFLIFSFAIFSFANIGVIVDVVGESTLIRNGQKIKITQKQTLKEHDSINTAKNAKVKLFFKDKTIVSLGSNTSFSIDSYLFTGKEDSNIKFKVAIGFFKVITGKIGQIAPEKFKLKTKSATLGIRGTVFVGEILADADVIICTDGEIIIFTPFGDINLPAGSLAKVKKGLPPKAVEYTQEEKEKLIKGAGWHGNMTLKELEEYIKNNFDEPLRSQLLETLQNIFDKDSDEKDNSKDEDDEPQIQSAEDIGFVDEITINGREFDSLDTQIEFYLEDLVDGKVVIKGFLDSDDEATSVEKLFVEITTDGGDTWNRASGHANWEWSFTPDLDRTYEFSLRVMKEN